MGQIECANHCRCLCAAPPSEWNGEYFTDGSERIVSSAVLGEPAKKFHHMEASESAQFFELFPERTLSIPNSIVVAMPAGDGGSDSDLDATEFSEDNLTELHEESTLSLQFPQHLNTESVNSGEDFEGSKIDAQSSQEHPMSRIVSKEHPEVLLVNAVLEMAAESVLEAEQVQIIEGSSVTPEVSSDYNSMVQVAVTSQVADGKDASDAAPESPTVEKLSETAEGESNVIPHDKLDEKSMEPSAESMAETVGTRAHVCIQDDDQEREGVGIIDETMTPREDGRDEFQRRGDSGEQVGQDKSLETQILKPIDKSELHRRKEVFEVSVDAKGLDKNTIMDNAVESVGQRIDESGHIEAIAITQEDYNLPFGQIEDFQRGDVVILGDGAPPEFRCCPAVVTIVADSHCTVAVLDEHRRVGIGECWPAFHDISKESCMLRVGTHVIIDCMSGVRTKHFNGLTGVISEHPREGHPTFIRKPSCPEEPQLSVCVRFNDPVLAKNRSALIAPRFLKPFHEFSVALNDLHETAAALSESQSPIQSPIKLFSDEA